MWANAEELKDKRMEHKLIKIMRAKLDRIKIPCVDADIFTVNTFRSTFLTFDFIIIPKYRSNCELRFFFTPPAGALFDYKLLWLVLLIPSVYGSPLCRVMCGVK